MVRPCTCHKRGEATCLPHRLAPLLAQREVGERLWSFTSGELLGRLRRRLAMLGVESAESYTLKCFRAGKATALVLSGSTLAAVLEAGEWRSRAFLNYVDANRVDAQLALEMAQAASDAEGDD